MSLISDSRAPSPAVQQSLLSRQTLRQLLGVAVGVACLLLALRVTAAETGGSDKTGSAKSSLDELGDQATALENRIKRMKDEADVVSAEVADSKKLQAIECLVAPTAALRGAVRLSEGYAEAVRTAVAGKDSKGASDALSQLTVMHERVSTALGEIKQCGSGGGAAADSAVQLEKQEGAAPDVKPEQTLDDLSAKSADTPSASPFFEEQKK